MHHTGSRIRSLTGKTALAVAVLFSTLPVLAQEQESQEHSSTQETLSQTRATGLSRNQTEAALRDLLSEEKANTLLTSAEIGRNPVALDTDDDIVPRRQYTPGVYGTLRELKRSLASEEYRRSPAQQDLLETVDAAEFTVLGLAGNGDVVGALNNVMDALHTAGRKGALTREQFSAAAKQLGRAVLRDRENRLKFVASRGASNRLTRALQTDIDNLKDILTRIGDGEAPAPFPNLKFGNLFDIDKFRSGVTQKVGPIGQLTGEVVGYSFSVWKDGEPYYELAGGKARRATDQPAMAQTPDKPLNVASTAKVLTAVAALKLLEETPAIGLDTSIQNHLPAGWAKGSGLNSVSFRDLLTYCSGFLGTNEASADSYTDLKFIIAAGVNSNYCEYENANFGMFRVLIPTITGNDPSQHFAALQPLMAAVFYAKWVRLNALEPAGVSAGLCEDPTNYPTMYYRASKPATASGHFKPTDLLFCGGGGWYLSADDWSRFLSHVRHSNYLSQASRKALYGDPLGFALNEDAPGVTWSKGGGWTNPEGAVRTCIFQSWNGITATLLFNSDTKTINPCSVLKDAFKEAWPIN